MANSRRVLWLLLMAQALLAVSAVLEMSDGPFGEAPVLDEESYVAWARQIAGGDWLGRVPFSQDPLYPYLIALVFKVGGGLLSLRLLNVAFLLGASALLFLLARRLFSPTAALVALACVALYGPLLLDVATIGKEPLLLLLCVAGWWQFEHARARPTLGRWLAFGALVGALCLLRRNFFLLSPLLLAGAALRAPRLRPLLAAALGMALALAPSSVRNLALGLGPSPATASSGFVIFIGNNPAATGTYYRPAWVRATPLLEAGDYQAEAERRLGRTLSPAENARYWVDLTTRFFADEPAKAAGLFFRKALILLNAYEVPNNHSLYCQRELFMPSLNVARLDFGWLWVLGALGLLGWRGKSSWAPWVFVLAYCATLVATFIVGRYRLPLVPVLAVGAGVGIEWVIATARARPRFAAAAIAFVLVAGTLVHLPAFGLRFSDDELGQCASLAGTSLDNQGRHAEAAPMLERAVALAPRNADAHYNLGVAVLHLKETEKARAEFLQTLALQPGHGGANFNLALLLADGAAPEQALPRLEKARAAGVDPLKTRLVERAVLLHLGRADEAAASLEAALALGLSSQQREQVALDLTERSDCTGARRVSAGVALSAEGLAILQRRCPN